MAKKGKVSGSVSYASGSPERGNTWNMYKAAFGLTDHDIENAAYQEKMNGYITPEFSDTDIMNYMYTQTSNNNARMMDFNRIEAQKARDWQEMMSNTAHQREVADLKAAGLNPVLSANGGAASYSGVAASSTTHDDAAPLASLYGTRITNANQLKMTKLTNKTNKEITAMNNAIGLQQAKYGYQSALATAGATKYAANANLAAAGISAAATQYASDQSRAAQEYSARMGYKTAKYQTDNNKTGSWAGMADNALQALTGTEGWSDIKSKVKNFLGW